ncbi:MAG: lipopolysaccharide assembly LapA domain-containing protein [bacterium]
MWVVKWVLAVAVILLILLFALQNSGQQVDVVLWSIIWQWKFQAVQLWMVIYTSFGLGVLFWLVVSIFQVFQLKTEIRRLKKANLEMQHELDSLRNLPLGEEEEGGFDLKEES